MPKLNRKKAERVREYCRKWDNSWRENNTKYHEMFDFIMGEQWEDDEEKIFTDLRKVPLSVNKLAPQLNHLVGEQRQNTPNLQIDPTDDVPEQVAEVRAALIKEISLDSHAKNVYQTAFEQSVAGGFSAWRIYTDYVDDDTFDQEIKLAEFKDPTKCFWDMGAVTKCKTDGMYSGYRLTVSRKKFRQLYGAQLEKKIGFTTTDVAIPEEITLSFSDEQSITMIYLFESKASMDTLYQLSPSATNPNGMSVRQKEYDALPRKEIDGKEMLMDGDDPVTVLQQRTFPVYKIKQSIWAGDYELETENFPSKQLPIVFLDQHSYWDKKGQQIIRSFFKDAKDSQRYLNYLRTQSAYIIMVSRYDQFMASKQNVRSADTEAMWRNPQEQQGALLYDESPAGNKPEQLRPPELSQSLLQQYESAGMDIQATTGMYDTQMGNQGNENSGVAIDARTERGMFNTYIPKSSLDHAMMVTGEIINEMIPFVYDTERMMKLELKDRGKASVTINKPTDVYGSGMQNDMTTGKYKIRLTPGASVESIKTEAQQSMDMVLSKNPQVFNDIADLYVENLPMANFIEMRNRLRARMDPSIIQAGKTGQPIPPKQPQQDPMIAIKQQEIQMKMQQAQMKAQNEIAKIQLEEKKLIMDSHNAGVNYATELQKLQVQKDEAVAQLASDEKRYQAEMARIQVMSHQGHAKNITTILTHQPNQQFEDEIPNDTSNGNQSTGSSEGTNQY